MDALPMKETSDVPFASKTGFTHSCGHDCHASMLLGAVKLLKAHEKELGGKVKFMFQPAEELLQGALDMIDRGLLENPHVDAAFAIHTSSGSSGSSVGRMFYSSGPALYSGDAIDIEVFGKQSHGSRSCEGVDAINIAAHIVIALEEIIAREIPSDQSSVVLVGKITGGDSCNTTAGYAKLEVSVRAQTEENREFLIKRITEISEGVAATYRGKAVVKHVYGIAPLVCDPTIAAIGAKAAKMMRHAKAQESRLEREIEKREALMHDGEYDERLKLHPEPYFRQNLLLSKDLSIFYGDRCVANGISLTLNRGDRIALVGRNGCGKSSLLKLLTGQPIAHTGTLEIGSRLTVSYVPQDMSFLSGSADDFAAESEIDITLFKTILRKLDFKRTHFTKDMSEFSMGQKKKVLLARSLCQRANLYIWDEPLNYIDVISRLQIETLILEYKPTMLFVEHDEAFVNDIATKVCRISLNQ